MKSRQIVIAIATITSVLFSGLIVAKPGNDDAPPTVDVNPQALVEYRYVGLTTHEDTGQWEYGGLVAMAAMNKACREDYGPSAKAATIAETYFRNDSDNRRGWVVPGGSPVTVNQASSGANFTMDIVHGIFVGAGDISEAGTYQRMYCWLYTTNDSLGIGVTTRPDGYVSTESDCTQSFPAACSAPVTLPVK